MNNDLDHNDQELQLLYRGIKRAKGFQLFLAQCDNQVLREKIQESLKRQLESGGITVYYQHLNAPMESLDEFLPRGVTIHKNEKAVLLVSGFEKSVLDTAEPQFFLHRLNFARDLLPKKIPIPLVLWLPAVVFKKILTEAHDLWSWRSGTFYFSETPKIELFQLSEGISKASFTEKEKPGVISEKFYKEQLAYFTHLLEDLSSSEGPGTTGLQQADVMQQMGDLHYSYAKTLRQPEQRKECLEQALAFQEKALDIKESLMGTLHPEVAKSYANLASIYFDMVQLDRALEFQLKDIEISEKILDKNHPSLATS
ncbi:MAG: tetratricopeptide repeat protein, partial [Acidobacteria bacterium]|nr:tetratricopeptide repeat protein [Acidobacteriota bacterium]